mmetsp:Transcript_44648/g.95025  ORF Transcript_44648/g.95025 Transcript_44648/m.95025 type:complete len:253 (-) Transcript_44648:430-1188(-)
MPPGPSTVALTPRTTGTTTTPMWPTPTMRSTPTCPPLRTTVTSTLTPGRSARKRNNSHSSNNNNSRRGRTVALPSRGESSIAIDGRSGNRRGSTPRPCTTRWRQRRAGPGTWCTAGRSTRHARPPRRGESPISRRRQRSRRQAAVPQFVRRATTPVPGLRQQRHFQDRAWGSRRWDGCRRRARTPSGPRRRTTPSAMPLSSMVPRIGRLSPVTFPLSSAAPRSSASTAGRRCSGPPSLRVRGPLRRTPLLSA